MTKYSKQTFIHVGMGKTGTTALQSFLYANKDLLSDICGILYPLTGLDTVNGHWHMSIYFSGREKEFPLPIRFSEEKLRQEIQDKQRQTLLFSSEYFYGLIREHLLRVRSYFDAFSEYVKIIVYLRRQDSYIQSIYSQFVKMPLFQDIIDYSIQEFIEKRISNFYFDRGIELYADVFGRENIIVRPYEKEQFYSGSLFSDFLHILGVELSAGFKVPQDNLNPSLGRDELEYKCLFNRISTLPISLNRQMAPVLLASSNRAAEKVIFQKHTLLSPAQCLEVLEKCAAGNQKIARQYLKRQDGCLFREPLPDTQEAWTPYPGLSPEKIREITAFIAQANPPLHREMGKAVCLALQSEEEKARMAAEQVACGFEEANHILEKMPRLEPAVQNSDKSITEDITKRKYLYQRRGADWLERLENEIRPAKTMLSEKGWIFLINDSSDFYHWCYGLKRWGQKEQTKVNRLFTERKKQIADLGAEYCKFIMPEKNIIYSEYMPHVFSDISLYEDRPAMLMARNNACVRYPAEYLKSLKGFGRLYFRGDTHINWLGAYYMYRYVHAEMCRLKFPAGAPIELDDLAVSVAKYKGDLYAQVTPQQNQDIHETWGCFNLKDSLCYEIRYALKEKPFTKAQIPPEYKAYTETREAVITECPDSQKPVAVIFRDSTCDFLIDFLSTHFRRAVYIWHKGDLFTHVIKQEKPDIVLNFMAERFVFNYHFRKPLL